MAEEYLANRPQLVLSIQLVDARHSPTTLDRQLYDWLTFHRKKTLVVATKADKLSNNKLNKSLAAIREAFPGCNVLPYSSLTGKGKPAVWCEIEEAVS